MFFYNLDLCNLKLYKLRRYNLKCFFRSCYGATMPVVMAFALLLSISSLCQAQSNTDSVTKPKISVDETVFNFPSVNEGDVVKHAFKVSNIGDALLEIRDISVDCGCTVVQQTKFSISPGESVDVNVEFYTDGFYGRKIKNLRLFTNDTENTTVLLSLKGFIKREAVANPPSVFFGNVKVGTKVSQIVSVNLKSGVTISDVYSHSQFLLIEKSKDYASGVAKTPEVSITLSENASLGVFRDNVFVRTSSAKQPVVTIPVFARVVGSVQFNPPDVSFGLVEKPISLNLSKIVKLVDESSDGNGARASIVSAESEDSQVVARVLKGKGDQSDSISVLLDQNANGTIRTEIKVVVENTDKERQELTVRVYAIVTERRAEM